jgi:thermitase
LDIPDGEKTLDILHQLVEMQDVIWAEANEVITMEFPQKTIDKPSMGSLLSNDPSVQLQWHLQFLEMDKYYKFFKENNATPKKKAKLYILDTGIDGKHEDLHKPEGGKDKQGHGTHCAGVAAAITNNGIGVASMVPSSEWVSVHGLQVIGDVGFGTQEQIIAGIIKAADNDADVISMSLGGITNQVKEKAYNDAVKYANVKGAIVIVAAGNANMDAKRYSPANAENVITVTAVNEKSEKSGFSNHVQNIVFGIAAPGERIFSTTPSNTYTSFNGTSMAAPQVAGLIAILKAFKPSITTQEAHHILHSSGKETQNTSRTGKLIQPLNAVKMLKN